MGMTKIAVLAGGKSDEREVSLRSGAAVAAALTQAGYEVTVLDPSTIDSEFENQIKSCDVVFPALHGEGGEDGSIQAWLEQRNIPYVGADSAVSAICFDKAAYKQKIQAADIITPKGEIVDENSFQNSELINGPFVLKPFDGGSSVDTFIIRNPTTTDFATVSNAFERHPRMLLEELVEGQEITVAILCDEVLPVIEIIPPTGGEFDYENKYNGKTQEICPPVSISDAVQAKAQKLALQIHHRLGVRDMSRTDIIVSKSGELYVLETNTIPGLTDQSLLPRAAQVAGYDMPTLTSRLVEAALSRTASA